MSKELRKWMPMFWADYFADTRHFNAAEHGAYLCLIGHYWINGGIPFGDDELLRRIASMTPRQWARSRDIVMSKFDDVGRHKRIDKELAYAIEKSKRLSANAKHRHSNGSAIADTPTPTPTKKEEERKKETPASRGATLIPKDWLPSEVHFELGKARGLSRQEVIDAGNEMLDWSLGGGKRKTNWDRTFNNWLRRNSKGIGNGPRGPRAFQDDSKSVSRAADRLIDATRRGEFTIAPRPSLLPPEGESNIRLLSSRRST